MIDLDDKLKILSENVTSNKTKHVLVVNEFHELSGKVKAISTKGLTKDLINIVFLMEPIFLFRNITNLFSVYTN